MGNLLHSIRKVAQSLMDAVEGRVTELGLMKSSEICGE